jgi:DNA mismatch repair ATPase MutS
VATPEGARADLDLVQLLDGIYAPFHFTDRVEPGGLVFEYKLTRGVSTTRNAIALLELNGAPPTLVARARARVERLTADERLPTTPDATS